MKASVQLGGECFTIEFPVASVWDYRKFRAYETVVEGPRMMRVSVDRCLNDDPYLPPRLGATNGGIRFSAHQTRWESDLSLGSVRACVAESPSALERAVAGWVSAVVSTKGGLSLHAAAVRSRRGALLLLGPTGAGKSTAASLAGDRRLCSNSVLLRKVAGRWLVYTTPFTNAADAIPALAGPFALDGALRLKKADQCGIPEPITDKPLLVFARALNAVYLPNAQCAGVVLEALADVAKQCPVAELRFQKHRLELPD